MRQHKSSLQEELTPKARRIKKAIGVEQGLDALFPSGRSSDLIIRFAELDGVVRVMLEPGANTTTRELRDAIPQVLQWRDSLRAEQATPMARNLLRNVHEPQSKEEILEHYWRRHERGASYAALAAHVNQRIALYVQELLTYRNRSHLSAEESHNCDLALSRANHLLRVFGIHRVDWDDGMNELAQGRPPFGKDLPVSRDRMIRALSAWEQCIVHIAAEQLPLKSWQIKKMWPKSGARRP